MLNPYCSAALFVGYIMWNKITGMPARGAVLLVRLYQKAVSPWLGQRCRFHPTCSNYCIDALQQHGMVYGLWLAVKRICKCHPLHPGGHDPVPGRKK
jgi:putative membrane protein insertion efficiency factor